jgi:uncharacterized protein YgiM (DUF1202 family)
MPNAGEPEHSLIRGQIVTVLQHRGEWYRIVTDSGEEGWVRESALTVIPVGEEEESKIDETSPDEAEEVVYFDFVIGRNKGNIRREPRLDAPVLRTADAGEVLNIVVESKDWYQVARNGTVEGWVYHTVGVKQESRNLSLRVLDLLESKLTIFDQLKNEAGAFRRAGWFPSFFLRSPEEDIVVEKDPAGGRSVLIHLAYARRDTDHRTVIAAADTFSLPGANRTFLADILLSIVDLSPEVAGVTIRLWSAVLEKGGGLSWQGRGEIELRSDAARGMPRSSGAAEGVWDRLEGNTIPPALWGRPGDE